MYYVVLFDNNSVGIVLESWLIPPNTLMWPSCSTTILNAALRKGEFPACRKFVKCTYTTLHTTGEFFASILLFADNFDDALKAQTKAIFGGHPSASEDEGTLQKRKRYVQLKPVA